MQSPNKNKLEVLRTHDVGIDLPMNTKYLSTNPISRWLIHRFIGTMLSMLSSINANIQTILDVGCGEGILPRQLRIVWPSALFHGLDIDSNLLKVALEIVPKFECMVGSIYNLPITSSAYNLVICTEVLEHLDNPDLALSEITRIGNGYFFFSVPNEPLWRLSNMARGAYWDHWGNSPGHINHWSSHQFKKFLSKHSTILNVKRSFPWILTLCHK